MSTPTTEHPSGNEPQTRAQRRRSPRPFGDGSEARRTPMAAGHVLLIGLILLMVGWLLNAQGVQKTAQGQSLGWRRDVAVFFADPVASVSHFLHTDRPRQWLKDALGRGEDDDVNTALPSPTTVVTVPGGVTTTTTLPPKEKFSPEKPLRFWVGGDSLSIIPGESLIDLAGSTEGVVQPVNTVDGHVSTGLARPEVDVNWSEYLKQITAQYDPNVVVFTVGSNDDQPLTGGPPTGDLGNPEWEAEYRRRVGGVMDQVVGEGRTLVWVGNPPIRNMERAEGEYKVINEIFRSEAAKRPGRVFYVDIYSMFLDGSGNYADYLDTGGGLVKVRGDDGIHFTRDGGNKIAGEIFKVLANNFDLTSWRGRVTTTTTAGSGGSAGPGGKSGTTTRTTRPPPATVGPGGPAVP
jgi:uncharacterized protein